MTETKIVKLSITSDELGLIQDAVEAEKGEWLKAERNARYKLKEPLTDKQVELVKMDLEFAVSQFEAYRVLAEKLNELLWEVS